MEWGLADPPLARSASLPSLVGGGLSCVGLDSGLDSEAASEAGCPRPARHCSRRTVTATMAQNYYPEGGWGWVVVLCHALANLLLHGVHGGYGVLAGHAQQQFRPAPAGLGESRAPSGSSRWWWRGGRHWEHGVVGTCRVETDC